MKHCDRFEGKAFGMKDFIAFYWRKKKNLSFAGKGAGAAKKSVIEELDKASKIDSLKSISSFKNCNMEIDDEVRETKVN